jgi:hypothetical protein
MQFSCQLTRRNDGSWVARYDAADLGPVEVTAATRDAALEKMRRELRYRLELCPCSGEQFRDVEIEVRES